MTAARDEHYPIDSILFLEELWGDGFLSPGGPEEVERLLSGVDLAGRTVVDIGSGTGGIALLLADRYGAARVIGLDVETTMVEYARAKVERAGVLDRIETCTEIPARFRRCSRDRTSAPLLLFRRQGTLVWTPSAMMRPKVVVQHEWTMQVTE